jgi:hypothetical protein
MVHKTVAQQCLTGSLKERVGDVAVLSTQEMLGILRVSRATYSRYRDELIKQEVEGFIWYFNVKGCDTIAGEYLFQYAKLVKQLGKTRADNRIKQHMEDFWNGKKNG